MYETAYFKYFGLNFVNLPFTINDIFRSTLYFYKSPIILAILTMLFLSRLITAFRRRIKEITIALFAPGVFAYLLYFLFDIGFYALTAGTAYLIVYLCHFFFKPQISNITRITVASVIALLYLGYITAVGSHDAKIAIQTQPIYHILKKDGPNYTNQNDRIVPFIVIKTLEKGIIVINEGGNMIQFIPYDEISRIITPLHIHNSGGLLSRYRLLTPSEIFDLFRK